MKALSLPIVLLSSGFVMADPVPAAPIEADPVVALTGIQVVLDTYYAGFSGGQFDEEQQGHMVTLLVSSKKPIIWYHRDKVKMTIGGVDTKSEVFMKDSVYSEDKKAMMTRFVTEDEGKVQLNAKSELEVKGKIPVMVASTKAEIRSAAFQARVGETITFPAGQKGLPTLKISSIEKDEDNYIIGFSTNMSMDSFPSVKFLTKDGKDVDFDSDFYTGSWFGTDDDGADWGYKFYSEQKELIIALEVWTDIEEKIIEVDLKSSLDGK
jgi:hypothetical protein